MTKDELASKLSGREYGSEITRAEAEAAASDGLVVAFGSSDDRIEFAGAIKDEVGAHDGATVLVDAAGLISRDADGIDDEIAESILRMKTARTIEAVWDPGDGYSWHIRTEIPHATFEILEDGEPFCRGIVFALSEVAP